MTKLMDKSLTRRLALAGGAALPLFSIRTRPAEAAQFTYRLANTPPANHPLNVQNAAALARIQEATSGRLAITLMPGGQFGTMKQGLAAAIGGQIEFVQSSGTNDLGSVIRPAGIVNLGFAFTNYAQVWAAVDGPFGDHLNAQIAAGGLVPVGKIFDSGFRQVTSSTVPINSPADLAQFKMRVPTQPVMVSMFRALGALVTPMEVNQVYAALQSHLIDGAEGSLAVIKSFKYDEVQKYCSLTNHVWDGYWTLANPAAFQALPADVQAIVNKEFAAAALAQRQDMAAQASALQTQMSSLTYNTVDPAKFRAALAASAYYATWKQKFGDQLWGLLEQATGALA